MDTWTYGSRWRISLIDIAASVSWKILSLRLTKRRHQISTQNKSEKTLLRTIFSLEQGKKVSRLKIILLNFVNNRVITCLPSFPHVFCNLPIPAHTKFTAHVREGVLTKWKSQLKKAKLNTMSLSAIIYINQYLQFRKCQKSIRTYYFKFLSG